VGLSATLMVIMAVVFIEAFWKWWELSRVKTPVKDPHGDLVLAVVPE
jgi:carbon starvation protein